MAWYEQLDLDFGNITDQFTDLIGEASTLLENANNLEILNLDAMAIQEELEEEQAADELEYEDENDEEVVHHDREVDEEFVPEVVHHSYDDELPSPISNARKDYSASAADNIPSNISSPARPSSLYSDAASAPSSTTKHLHFEQTDQSFEEENTPEADEEGEMAESQPLEDSFAWETMDDKTPKKSTKLSPQIRNRSMSDDKLTTAPSATEDTSASESLEKKTTKQVSHTDTATASATKVKAPPKVSTTSATTNASTASTTGDRKARPLKPKPKVSKEFDFWGVNSKKTLNFEVLKNKPTAKQNQNNTGTATEENKAGEYAVNASTNMGSGSVADVTTTVSEHFYGVVGLFGDDYGADIPEPDIESNTLTNENAANDNTTVTNSTATTSHRLPLGWLSDIYATTTTTTNDESFFDHLEEEEDPILRQVELNKTNPYNSVSNVDRLWNMWENMTGGDVEAGANSESNSSTDNSGSGNNINVGTFVPLTTPGTGPGWVVTSLNAVHYVTGVTLMVQSNSGNTVYSSDIISTPNNNYPHWPIFTVKLVQPVDYQYKSIILFALSILRMPVIIFVAVVLRIIVFVCKLLGMCISHCVVFLRATPLGARMSRGRARLRAFFANERVDRILGGSEPPSELTWQERAMESGRAFMHARYEQMNSTNGIMLLTAVLFLFSYFKFQRYGTDAGD
eukprot:gene11416-13270_t